MAQNLAPSHWLPGYSAASGAITIPLSALDGLSAEEADADGGDIRKVLRALSAAVHAAWLAEPAEDRPRMMLIARFSSVDDSTGETTRTYQAQFQVATTGEEVVAEPED